MRLLSRLFTKPRADDAKVSLANAAATSSRTTVGSDRPADIAGAQTPIRRADALARLDNAVAEKPNDTELLFERGSLLFSWARYSEARETLSAAQRRGLRSGQLFAKLGWSSFWMARLDDALQFMRDAVAAAPDDWSTHFGLATVLRAQAQPGAGRAAFERALQLDPDNLHCISALVNCALELDDLDSAERFARRGVELVPDSVGCWSDLGMVLCSQGRFDDAIAAFEHAQSLHAATADPTDDHVNFAICLLRSARTKHALTLLESTLAARPTFAAHSQYALALLISGRLREGWDQYEYRWATAPLNAARPNFVAPAWTGQDLTGKSILLRAEQGFGDFIQFIRYARHVKALGATVIVHLREETRGLAEGVHGIDKVIGQNEPYPPFDFYVNLLSIPRVFGTDLASIPADVGYIAVDPDLKARWKTRLAGGDKLKVGLVWAGSPTHLRDRFRSLTPAELGDVTKNEHAQFYSLQKGPAAAQLSDDRDRGIVDLGPELRTFADTAAAVSALDLVIGVDTAVVHLAGALGKPVWVLIPSPADWRWLEHRDDSPWYPTMRLFRQAEPGQWAGPVERVVAALEAEVRDRGRAANVSPAVVKRSTQPLLQAAAWPLAQSNSAWARIAETRTGIMQYFPELRRAGASIEWYGEYLQTQVDVLSRLVMPAMTIVEMGAGFGTHALWLASAVGPAGHVFLQEDNPRYRLALQQNLRSNGFTNITLPRDWRSVVDEQATESATIDELRLPQFHWLKIDERVDAAAVLRGATDTLWRWRPRLFLAAPDAGSVAALAGQAKDLGYACWQVTTPLFNPANFNRRSENIFPDQSVLALLAMPEELGVDVAHAACSRVA